MILAPLPYCQYRLRLFVFAANRRYTPSTAGKVISMAGEYPSDPLLDLDERRRKEREAVDEAGGGESEGFELAEQELIEHTSHGDEHAPAKIAQDAWREGEEDSSGAEYGEADQERISD
jgi:hypothetical protein